MERLGDFPVERLQDVSAATATASREADWSRQSNLSVRRQSRCPMKICTGQRPVWRRRCMKGGGRDMQRQSSPMRWAPQIKTYEVPEREESLGNYSIIVRVPTVDEFWFKKRRSY